MIRSRSVKALLAFVLAACGSGLLVTAQQVQQVGTWQAAAPVADSRTGAGTVVLADGRTLVTGGRLDEDGSVTDSIVIYDPVANVREPIGHLHAPRVGHTATLLTDGRVLVIGGSIDNSPTNEIELIDLSFAPDILGSTFAFLNQPRTRHAATLLRDGRVLIVGGSVPVYDGTTTTYVATDSAELYDPESGQVTMLPERLNEPRAGLSATTTIDGRVLIAGGSNATGDLKSAELFDPVRGFELLMTELSVARSGHTAILLPHNNTVLIAGGTSAGAAVTTTDAFLPAQFPDPFSYGVGAFAPADSMPVARTRAFGGPHGDNGFAYVAGGGSADSAMYRFPTVRTDKSDYAPGERAVITGSGWEPNATVTLTFQEDPAVHDDYVLTVPTDADGTFTWDQWAPEQHDFDVRFYLLVTDARSRAQITFTDGNATSVTGTVVSSAAGAPPISGATITCTSGCNSTSLSTTSNASGNYAFNNSTTKLSFAGNGPVTLRLTAAKIGFVSQTITLANINNGDSVLAADFVLTPACTAASVTTNPASQAVTFGATSVSFSAAGSGSPAPTVQWQESVDAGQSWTNLAGQTDTTLTLANPTVSQSGSRYQAVFSNNCSGAQTATTIPAVLTVNPAPTTTAAANASATFNPAIQNVTLTASVTSAAGTVNVGTVTFTIKDGASTIGVATTSGPVTSGSANVSYGLPAALAVKSYTIEAVYNQPSGGDFASSTDAGHTLTVGKANQTITFGPLSGKTFGDADFSVSATATSTLAVTFAASGSCSISGDLVHITGAGSCSITASQAGDDNYNAATDVSQTFTIAKAPSTTTVTVADATYDGNPHGGTAHVTGVGGLDQALAVTYVGRNGTSYPSSTTAPIDAGDYSASASFAGDANHDGSHDSKDFSVAKANQTITFNALGGKTFGDADFTVSATATSNLGVTFAANGSCSVSDDLVHISGAGSCTITASQAGNGNYNAATDVPQTFTIGKAKASITVTPYSVTYDATAHTATGSATGVGGADLSVLLNLTATTHTNAGSYTDTWSFAGNNNYLADNGSVTDTINRATLTVKAADQSKIYDGAPFSAFTATITGFVNGETAAVVTGMPGFVTAPTNPAVNPGTYSITPNGGTLAAANYQFAFDPGTLRITYGTCSTASGPGNVILPPINGDGSSVYNRKGGSTIPVKFRVCDASGRPISDPSLVFASNSAALNMLSAVRGTVTVTNEDATVDIPDSAFRWTGQEWIFNMATSNLTSGTTYRFQINLLVGNPIGFQVGVR